MLSTIDLFELTCLDQLLCILKILFTFLTKQATLMYKQANVGDKEKRKASQHLTLGLNVIKLFTSVIYECLY